MRKTVSLKIEPEVWKEAKRQALERNLTVSAFVETAIIHLVREVGKRGKPRK